MSVTSKCKKSFNYFHIFQLFLWVLHYFFWVKLTITTTATKWNFMDELYFTIMLSYVFFVKKHLCPSNIYVCYIACIYANLHIIHTRKHIPVMNTPTKLVKNFKYNSIVKSWWPLPWLRCTLNPYSLLPFKVRLDFSFKSGKKNRCP